MLVPVHGAHVSIVNGFLGAAIQSVEEYGANAMQIFIKSPRARGSREIEDKEAAEFKKYAKQSGLRFFVAHCSYLLNFGRAPEKNKWAIDLLVNDVDCVEKLGGNGVVLHVGKSVDTEKSEAIKNIVRSIDITLERTKNIPLLLETTAGQGTEIGWRFEELKEIYRRVKNKKRVLFCVDTCHIFAAGYDLRNEKAVKKTFGEWDKLIGINKIACIHFNDSQKGLGSRVDRHEILGKGLIGKEGLVAVTNMAKRKGIPLIIETPEKTRTHQEDLEILQSWLKKTK